MPALPTTRRARYLFRRRRYLKRVQRQRNRIRAPRFPAGSNVGRQTLRLAGVYFVGDWQPVYYRSRFDLKLLIVGGAGFITTEYPLDGIFYADPPRIVFTIPHHAWESLNGHQRYVEIERIPWRNRVHGRKLQPVTTGKRRTRAIRYAQRVWKVTGEWPIWAPVGWKVSTP